MTGVFLVGLVAVLFVTRTLYTIGLSREKAEGVAANLRRMRSQIPKGGMSRLSTTEKIKLIGPLARVLMPFT